MSMMAEEESAMQTESAEPLKDTPGTASGGNGNFVVLDMAGDSEDSDKEGSKETKEKHPKSSGLDSTGRKAATDSASKPAASVPRMRKKPKAPVVDVSCLRKRKWQLKVYPLHADDLQLNYVSILCKLASESLLYIPSESRHGKAELYVATQKETAAIIGKLLRMGFHHQLMSIEVVRKDTGGKEDGDESKKECKAFLMFDKFLSKKIFDAKGEKGTLIEKTVTLNKLPKAATKDFIGALFPFATEIEIIDSDKPDERKATVKCKTPVTSLLVYKSFKRLEINDIHVKLSVDESVKAIQLPRNFFIPPEKKDMGPPDSHEAIYQSSLLPRRPMMSSLNRRVQLIKKRAMLTRKKPTRGQMIRAQRLGGMEDVVEMPSRLSRNSMTRRGIGSDAMNSRDPGGRDYPGGPGRRRMIERQGDRRNRDRDSMERGRRRGSGEGSQVTGEMLQLQNQLNQAIKNQIAMLNTAQGSRGPGPIRGGGLQSPDSFSVPGSSQRTSLLGQGPRRFGGAIGAGSRGMDQRQSELGRPWPMDRGQRMDRHDRGGGDRAIPRTDRANRPERTDRLEPPGHMDVRSGERIDRGSRDRAAERPDRNASTTEMGHQQTKSTQRQTQPFGSSASESGSRTIKAERSHGGAAGLNSSHESDPGRGSSRSGRGSSFSGTNRASQRNEASYTGQSSNSTRYNTAYPSQRQGENGSYYRRY